MARNKYRSNGFGNVWAILNGRAGAIRSGSIPTDVEFTVRQTERGTKADIQSIHGNTLVWNQLVPMVLYPGSSKFDNDNGHISVSGNKYVIKTDNPTSSAGFVRITDVTAEGSSFFANHKVLFGIVLNNSGSPTTYQFRWSSAGNLSSTNPLTLNSTGSIITHQTALANRGIFLIYGAGISIDAEVKINIIDLTIIYGAGNEPTTVADFRKWFSSDFYPFSEPYLLNFTGTGIKSEGEGWSETRVLPTATYFPTGMKSAGSVYDELTPDKAITRIGSRAYEEGDENDPTVITDGTTTLYPLATPTEVPISPPLNLSYRVEKGGTETLLPINGSVPTTTPFVGTIDYLIDYTGIVNALTLLRRLDLRDEDFLTIGLALIESRARAAEEDQANRLSMMMSSPRSAMNLDDLISDLRELIEESEEEGAAEE